MKILLQSAILNLPHSCLPIYRHARDFRLLCWGLSKEKIVRFIEMFGLKIKLMLNLRDYNNS